MPLPAASVRVLAAVLVASVRDLPVDVDDALVEIDVLPPQTERFACRSPSASAIDQRVPLRRLAVVLRNARASAPVRFSIERCCSFVVTLSIRGEDEPLHLYVQQLRIRHVLDDPLGRPIELEDERPVIKQAAAN